MAYAKKKSSPNKKKSFTPCATCKSPMACMKMGRCMKGGK